MEVLLFGRDGMERMEKEDGDQKYDIPRKDIFMSFVSLAHPNNETMWILLLSE